MTPENENVNVKSGDTLIFLLPFPPPRCFFCSDHTLLLSGVRVADVECAITLNSRRASPGTLQGNRFRKSARICATISGTPQLVVWLGASDLDLDSLWVHEKAVSSKPPAQNRGAAD